MSDASLNSQQSKPLAMPLTGVQLIEASAGTGKTWTISSLFVRLLLERGLNVNQILVVTFTNAATAELKDRIRARIAEIQQLLEHLLRERQITGESNASAALQGYKLAEDPLVALLVEQRSEHYQADIRKLTSALYGFDEVSIATIHSFSQKLLSEHAFNAGAAFETELIEDEQALITELVDDYWRKNIQSWPAPVSRYLLASHGGEAGPSQLASGLRPWVSRRRVALPEISKPDDKVLEALDKASGRFWRVWENAADAKEYLISSKDLSRNKVRPATCQKLLNELEAIRNAGGEFSQQPANLKFLTKDFLGERLNKLKTLKDFPLWAAGAELFDAFTAYEQWHSDYLHYIRVDLLAYLRQSLPSYKRERGLRSFDDFLNDLDDALSGNSADDLISAVSKQYPVVLVDEFQDTDSVQFDNFRRLFAAEPGNPTNSQPVESPARESALFLVGDPKQAIYGFRGADVHAYLNARTTASKTHSLATNWRSTAEMIAAVNSLFLTRADAFVLDGIDYQPVEAASSQPEPLKLPAEFADSALTVWELPPPTDSKGAATAYQPAKAEAEVWPACAGTISKLLQAGQRGDATIGEQPLQAADIAVLVRGHKQAAAMQAALRKCGVYSLRQDRSSVWHSDEAHELRRVLLAILQPQRATLLRSALATRLLGLRSAELEQLKADSKSWDGWLMSFRQAQLDWHRRGLASAWRTLANRHGVVQRVLAEADGQRQLTNLNQIIELLVVKDAELRDPAQLMDYFTAQILSLAETSEAAQLRLESDAALVRIVTIHVSKGLEYPLVFCPAPFSKIPTPKASTLLSWHGDNGLQLGFAGQMSEDQLAQYQREQLAEDVRLQYVALTRAKYRCWLSWGALKLETQDAALAWLLPNQDVETDSGMSGWQALAANPAASIGIQPLPEFDEFPRYNAEQQQQQLQAREAHRHISQSWRVTSFTGLAAGHGEQVTAASIGEDQNENPDYDQSIPRPDELVVLEEIAPEANAAIETTPTSPENKATVDEKGQFSLALELQEPASNAPLTDSSEPTIHSFPRGAQAGLFMHRVLENLTLNNASKTQIETEVSEGLEAFGFNSVPWLAVVSAATRKILDTPLSEAGCALSTLATGAWRPEMEFHYPLTNFQAEDFKALLRRHKFGAGTEIFERIERLDFASVNGFMKGFIDLIFEANGQYFIVDYKSNWLGADSSAYGPQALAAAVAEADYWLQYLIYSVALHRYLQQRLPNYSYKEHFGGAYYLFLRGMGDGQQGIFFDRPNEQLIIQLDAMLKADPSDFPMADVAAAEEIQ